MNIIFQETNTLHKHFQCNIIVWNPKDQFQKEKRKSSPKSSKVGYIMYITINIQVQELLHNMIRIINKDKDKETESTIKLEASFQI